MKSMHSILATSLLGASVCLLGCSGQSEPGAGSEHLNTLNQADKQDDGEHADGDDDDEQEDAFQLTSLTFASGAAIPDANTCNDKPFGSGVSPALRWKHAPKHTKSFALVFKDTSLTTLSPPDNRGWHWVIWDIPKKVDSLPSGLASTEFLSTPSGARQWSRYSPFGYLGPCPNFDPVNVPIHTDNYSLTLYALDVKILAYPAPDPAIPNYTRLVDEYLAAHAIGKTELLGTSAAIPSAPPVPPGPPPAPSPRP